MVTMPYATPPVCPEYWVLKDGTQIRIADMEYPHLINSAYMLARNGIDPQEYFAIEFARRGVNKAIQAELEYLYSCACNS